MRINFQEIAVHSQKSVLCAGGCKRRLKRSRKFWQTLSPFNKNASGQPKSKDEIYAALREESAAWIAEPETCSHCKSNARAA